MLDDIPSPMKIDLNAASTEDVDKINEIEIGVEGSGVTVSEVEWNNANKTTTPTAMATNLVNSVFTLDTLLKIISALNIIAPEIIIWPDQARRQEISMSFEAKTGLPGVVGAIDSTYVPITAPTENPRSYYCRKMSHAINLQGVCDHNTLFLDFFAAYPGAVADVRVLRNSDICIRQSSS
ncbi:hypothetical protein HCN44_009991 [Aphidius gifuensis]|uniref:DDE Tnp4 domain-containing protein n=1 Tax=Aphidius gifuensis TaxID=684658 RepID=A0A835CX29_APHGI|nr:hypothetical protein HCN44_009991 [Aphidius gifuensis]